MLPAALAVFSGICFGSWALALKRGKNIGFDAFFSLWYATIFAAVFAGCLFIDGPGLASGLKTADAGGLAWGIGGGAGWGIATLTFGYALSLVGLALSYALILGIGMFVGTSVSMALASGTPQGLSGEQAVYGILGMLVALSGTVFTAYSGQLKSGASIERKNFGKGIAVCVLSGLLSSLFAVGYAEARITLTTWPAIFLLTSGFWAAQLIVLCLRYIRGSLNLALPRSGLIFPVTGGLVFALGVIFHYASADSVGVALSYPMMMGIQILTGNVWSIALGEWKFAPRKAVVVQILSLLLLLLASLLVGLAMSGGQ